MNDTERLNWLDENKATTYYSEQRGGWEIVSELGVWERATIREVIDAAASDARPYNQ